MMWGVDPLVIACCSCSMSNERFAVAVELGMIVSLDQHRRVQKSNEFEEVHLTLAEINCINWDN